MSCSCMGKDCEQSLLTVKEVNGFIKPLCVLPSLLFPQRFPEVSEHFVIALHSVAFPLTLSSYMTTLIFLTVF